MVAVWNQKVNPWGATGGNPMVKVNFRGRQMWSYYKHPSTSPVIDQIGAIPLPNPKYQNAWDSMYSYYVIEKGLPVFDMAAAGYTLGHPDVPGFTYNNTDNNNVFEAFKPSIPIPVIP